MEVAARLEEIISSLHRRTTREAVLGVITEYAALAKGGKDLSGKSRFDSLAPYALFTTGLREASGLADRVRMVPGETQYDHVTGVMSVLREPRHIVKANTPADLDNQLICYVGATLHDTAEEAKDESSAWRAELGAIVGLQGESSDASGRDAELIKLRNSLDTEMSAWSKKAQVSNKPGKNLVERVMSVINKVTRYADESYIDHVKHLVADRVQWKKYTATPADTLNAVVVKLADRIYNGRQLLPEMHADHDPEYNAAAELFSKDYLFPIRDELSRALIDIEERGSRAEPAYKDIIARHREPILQAQDIIDEHMPGGFDRSRRYLNAIKNFLVYNASAQEIVSHERRTTRKASDWQLDTAARLWETGVRETLEYVERERALIQIQERLEPRFITKNVSQVKEYFALEESERFSPDGAKTLPNSLQYLDWVDTWSARVIRLMDQDPEGRDQRRRERERLDNPYNLYKEFTILSKVLQRMLDDSDIDRRDLYSVQGQLVFSADPSPDESSAGS